LRIGIQSKPHTFATLQKLKLELTGHYTLIDEISMLDYDGLIFLESTLREIGTPSVMFGGFNIIIVGDLQQLSPVKGKPSFSYQDGSYTHPWTYITKNVILLDKQHRADGDPQFQSILQRARNQNPSQEDLEVLNSIIMKNLPTLNLSDQCWLNAPILTPRNDLSRELYSYRLHAHCKERNQKVILISSLDVIGDLMITSRYIKTTLIKMEDDGWRDLKYPLKLPRKLALGDGCRVVSTRNLCTSLGLVNGGPGTTNN
jgi:hypothetical protein